MSNVGAGGTADLVPPEELVRLVEANWPWSEWSNALAISLAESVWDVNADYDSTDDAHPCGAVLAIGKDVTITAEHSVGPYQINLCNYMFAEWDRLKTLEGNVAEAAALWRERGWQPWYFSAQALGLL